MANEITTTSHNDVYFAAWVSDRVLDEVRPYNVCRPFFRYEGAQKSNAYDFPIQDDPGAGGATAGEGTGFSNTAMTSSKATATVGTVGQMATVTDELVAVSVMDAYSHFGNVLGRSVAEKYETDMTALLDDFANTTGTSGQPFTYAQLLEAVNQLEQRDQVGQAVGVIDPIQVGHIRNDLGTSAAAFLGNPMTNINGVLSATLDGFAFELGGAPWYQTSLCATTGADVGGAVFLSDLALGMYEIWGPRTELERDASMPGTELVCTARYGVTEIRDVAGETIATSAT